MNPFEYLGPSPEQVEKITQVREKCKELYDLLMIVLPNCPYEVGTIPHQPKEKSMAIARLEECSMWANKCIVFN